jgi:tetratricopeptide (TPR) repeat protein
LQVQLPISSKIQPHFHGGKAMLRQSLWAAIVAGVWGVVGLQANADPGEFPNFEAAAKQAGRGNLRGSDNSSRSAKREKFDAGDAAYSTGSRQPATSQAISKPSAANAERPRKASAEQPIPAAAGDAGEAEILAAYALTKTAREEAEFTEMIERLKAGVELGVSKKMAEYGRTLTAWAHNKRGELRAAADLPEDALDDFETAVSLDHNNWRAINNRGVSRAVLGDAAGAIADFSRVLELNPRFASAYFNRAEMRYERRDFAGAIDDYTRSLKSAPRDAAAFNSRGHAFYRLGRHEQAMADYNRALQIDPGNAAALVNRGDLHADMGDFAAAAEDYRSAISAQPEFGRAYQSAAWLMATCPDERFRDAPLGIEIAQKAIELDGTGDYRYLETLSAAQANAGEFEMAAETLADAMQFAPAAVAEVYRQRIGKFQAGHPHREPAKKVAAMPPIRR